MSESEKQRRGLLAVLPIWLQIVISLVTVGGFILAVINYLNPIGKIDLTVWVQQEAPIVLPTEANSAPIKLKYKDEELISATIMKVNIFNSGSTPLGESGQWNLTIKTDPQSRVVLLTSPETKPPNLELTTTQDPSQNHLTLQFGLLNPGDYANLRLIFINPTSAEHPTIKAETRIPNLSEPVVTREPLGKRFEDAYQWPFFIFFWVILSVPFMWFLIKRGVIEKPKNIQGGFNLFGMIILPTFLSGFFALVITRGVVWILIRLVSNAIRS